MRRFAPPRRAPARRFVPRDPFEETRRAAFEQLTATISGFSAESRAEFAAILDGFEAGEIDPENPPADAAPEALALVTFLHNLSPRDFARLRASTGIHRVTEPQ